MRVVKDKISLNELKKMSEKMFGRLVKPDKYSKDWIEFDSMINVRPSWGNRSRSVEAPLIQEKIITIVSKLVEK